MSNLAAKAYFVQDSFARLLGVELLSAQDGQACVTFFASSEHCNGLGGVHGAVIFALADIAFAVACNTRDIRRWVSMPPSTTFMALAPVRCWLRLMRCHVSRDLGITWLMSLTAKACCWRSSAGCRIA